MCFPSLPPQQQIEIKLRTPRSGDVNYAWNHEQSDANLMLNAKQHKNISLGAASFVGEIAQIVANFLQNNSSFKFGEVSFSRNGTDIMASLGIYSSYESIIERMNSNGTATNKTAKQITDEIYRNVLRENKNILNDESSLYSQVYNVAQKSLPYAYYTPAINNAQSARTVAQEKYEASMSGSIKDVEVLVDDIVSQVQTSIGRN